MKVVYADFNDFDEHGNLPLTCRGSIESIRAVKPDDGELVVLTDGELFVTAMIRKIERGQFEAVSARWEFRTTEE
jgi:hypothetical protein